jgi:hypothetical protein
MVLVLVPRRGECGYVVAGPRPAPDAARALLAAVSAQVTCKVMHTGVRRGPPLQQTEPAPEVRLGRASATRSYDYDSPESTRTSGREAKATSLRFSRLGHGAGNWTVSSQDSATTAAGGGSASSWSGGEQRGYTVVESGVSSVDGLPQRPAAEPAPVEYHTRRERPRERRLQQPGWLVARVAQARHARPAVTGDEVAAGGSDGVPGSCGGQLQLCGEADDDTARLLGSGGGPTREAGVAVSFLDSGAASPSHWHGGGAV